MTTRVENKQDVTSNDNALSVSRRDVLKMAGAAGGALGMSALLAASPVAPLVQACQTAPEVMPLPDPVTQPITPKDFTALKDRVSGISWQQLSQHVGLYEGYVKKLNASNAALQAGNATDMRTLQQKHSYSLNGALLHDWYFSNLGEDQPTMGTLTRRLIMRDFGSQDKYLADVASVGKSMRGWVVTGLSLLDNKVYNYGLDTHDTGTPLWFHPLVVLDVYEHAYMIDFGTNKANYLDVFGKSIRWNVVETRVKQALTLRKALNA